MGENQIQPRLVKVRHLHTATFLQSGCWAYPNPLGALPEIITCTRESHMCESKAKKTEDRQNSKQQKRKKQEEKEKAKKIPPSNPSTR